jgi:hypothetical protein
MQAIDESVLPTFKYRLPPETTWTLFGAGANASDTGGYYKSVDWTAGQPKYELSVFGGSTGFQYAMWKEPSGVLPECRTSPTSPCSTCNLNSLALYGKLCYGWGSRWYGVVPKKCPTFKPVLWLV